MNPRPLTVTRIYEKKVILKNAEAAAVLAKEEELSDKKEKINVYKSKYCLKKMVFVKEAQNIFQLVEFWINHYLSKQMPASE